MIPEYLFEEVSFIVIGLSRSGKVLFWNKMAEDVTGYSKKEVMGKEPPLFILQLYKSNNNLSTVKIDPENMIPAEDIKDKESTILTKMGELKVINWSCHNVYKGNDEETSYVITGNDITDHKISEGDLTYKTKYVETTKKRLKKYLSLDPHTGILNYRHFIAAVSRAFSASRTLGQKMAVILIDITYVSSINSMYGFSVGNKILKKVAQLIKQNISKDCKAGRFSGKEFAILMPGSDIRRAFKLARKLFAVLTNHGYMHKNREMSIDIKTSMAIGGFPHCEDAYTYEQLLDRVVDKLMESKRRECNSILICSPRMVDDHVHIYDSNGLPDGKDFKYTLEFVHALANAVKTKDYYIREHSAIMANYAAAMAEYLGMSNKDIQNVKYGAMLHDIGKIGIDKLILSKPSRLSEEEFNVIRQHPRIGAEIIRNVHPLREVVPFVLYHHERFNGEGYLQGLRGEEIPLGARIISIADVFQALTSDRPYRKALSIKKAFAIVKEYSGDYFDPKVVKAFFETYQD